MIILGVDPGIAITGFGVVEYINNTFKVLDYGCIRTEAGVPLPDRLNILYDGLGRIVNKYCPNEMAVEELFFSKNVRTALTVGHARGVTLLAARQRGVEIFEYTPLQVKQAVVGHGRADKVQVQYMVRVLLCLSEIPSPDDVADALAVAICHSFRGGEGGELQR